jgi:hypothetical protein
MKLVFSSYWGRPTKIASRGLRAPDGRTEAYLMSQLVVKTSMFVEKIGFLAFPVYAGSFRNNCYFANKIHSDLYSIFTFGTQPNLIIQYGEKCDKSEELARKVIGKIDTDFAVLSGGVNLEKLKRKEKRYGMISFLSPTIPSAIFVFPFDRYYLIKKYLDFFASRIAYYLSSSLIEMKSSSFEPGGDNYEFERYSE